MPLLLGALAEQRFFEARARGMGDEDMAALVKLWEEPAGVTVARLKAELSVPRFAANLSMLWPSWTCMTASAPPPSRVFAGRDPVRPRAGPPPCRRVC